MASSISFGLAFNLSKSSVISSTEYGLTTKPILLELTKFPNSVFSAYIQGFPIFIDS